MDTHAAQAPDVALETHPSRYHHWTLELDGEVARLVLKVQPFGGVKTELELKSNSYDLSVDVELADAVQRLRFTHPQVKALVITSGHEKVFCAGANIYMLASSTHPFKVNFCKYTNETRLYLEELSAESGVKTLCAANGACAGGGYELALACDEIALVDDGSSTVSLPEVPLLGVLPGTGGLTRVVDKRKVRRDRADAFSTQAEGVKGKRALQWGLVDAVIPRSKFEAAIALRAKALAAAAPQVARGAGVELEALEPRVSATRVDYRFVKLDLVGHARVATLTVKGPELGGGAQPANEDAALAAGSSWWPLRMARELDDALLRLRFLHGEVGLVLLETRGDHAATWAAGELLASMKGTWLGRETRLLLGRVLRRLDLMSKSLFAVCDEQSNFCGPLFELLIAADRSYLLDQDGVSCRPGALSSGLLPTWAGVSRLQGRFQADAKAPGTVVAAGAAGALDAGTMDELGLATTFADDLDFAEELRVAVEERVSLSPDALTGMEASYRFPGAETMATKIFGRLSAWQNWIFIRPNATGEHGALTVYGKPERPRFDFRRT